MAAPPDTADPRAWLEAAREVRAARPGPGADALRTAYLELLKLCLCDLTATSTGSVGAMPDGGVLARELRGDGRRLRAAGMDWPLQGLTMVGLRRLDDLQRRLETVVADGVPGDVIEAGAWRGGASILARATLDALGDERTVWVADSFQGFPDAAHADAESDRLRDFDFLRIPLEEVRESFARLGLDQGVEFVPGFFADTLPALRGRTWALIRLDADSYEATRDALRDLYPGLAPGGFLLLDDYGSFEGCKRAVDEFRAEHGIADPIEVVDYTGAGWRRTGDAAVPALEPGPAPAPHPAPSPSEDRHVPTEREAELAARLEQSEAQLAQLRDAGGLLRDAGGLLRRVRSALR